MAICQNCDKQAGKGHLVSHSNQKTIRKFKPNLKKVKVFDNGQWQKMTLCTKCLKKRRKEPA